MNIPARGPGTMSWICFYKFPELPVHWSKMGNKSVSTADIIRKRALDLAFDACGITRAEFLGEDAARLEDWLRRDMHAGMKYMERHIDKRADPSLLVPGAKSVISVLLNYYPKEAQTEGGPMIAKYAYGRDYHFVMKEKLLKLLEFVRSEFGRVEGRVFVDSAPVLERALAVKAGLGWIGKNTMLISRKHGSFVFIGEIICDLELPDEEYDEPRAENYCGTCTRCLEACPVGALVKPYLLDSNRCISYLTIEKKGNIPSEFKGKLAGNLFGCDVCQDVCPWNGNPKPTRVEEFAPTGKLLAMSQDDWRALDRDEFGSMFSGSAVSRAGYDKTKDNLDSL